MPAGPRAWLARAALTGQLALVGLAPALLLGRRLDTPGALALGALESALLVRVLAGAATGNALRALLALALATLLVAEAVALRGYGALLDAQMVAAVVHARADVWPVLRAHAGPVALGVLALGGVELALLHGARFRPARRRELALLALAGLFGPPPREATPEVRLASGLGAVARARPPAARGVVDLPPLFTTRTRLPDVLFVVGESVRADVFCERKDATCTTSPALDRVLPGRHPLGAMRSLASYTAVSVSALLTGLPQTGPRGPIAAAPMLFDWARAVRGEGDARYRVAFLSAQSREVFEARDVASAVDLFVTLESFGGSADDDDGDVVARGLDRRVADACARFAAEEDAPILVVAQLGGTHAPYFVDEDHAPFRPYSHTVSWAGLEALRNAYRDAVVAQDESLARCAEAVVRRGRPWVVAFTSDHGEAFGEHGAIHHGQNLWDEQLRVPGFVAAGAGSLAPAEEAALGALGAGLGARATTHLDVLPTLLDALGVLDTTPWPATAPLPGRSLLRPLAGELAPTPLSNCTQLFPCPLDTWGLLGERRKLHGQPWDADWRCTALDDVTGETDRPLDEPACAALRQASRAVFATAPNGRANRP